MATEKLYDLQETADHLRIGRTMLLALVRSGELGSITIGRRRLVPPESSINSYIARQLDPGSVGR